MELLESIWGDPVYRAIVIFVAAEIAILLVQVLWLLFRSLRDRRNEKLLLSFEELLRHNLYPALEDEELKALWVAEASLYPETVQRAFLEPRLLATTGSYQKELAKLYEELGLLQRDIERAYSPFWHQRMSAIRRLVPIARTGHESVFLDRSQDIHAIRLLAALGLSRIGKAEDIFQILRGIKLASRLMEQPLFNLFHKLEKAQLFFLLGKWDHFESPYIRKALLVVGMERDPASSYKWLSSAITDPSKEVRIGAAQAAGRMTNKHSLTFLLKFLEDKDFEVRAQAARALGDRKENQALDALSHAASDVNFWVRQNAVSSLMKLGGGGREKLESLLIFAEDAFAADAALEGLERHRLNQVA